MKVKFILGRAGSGKTAYCLDEIRRELRSAAEGNCLLMILPEHATFKTEKLLAGTPGLNGFARSYVFGFKRLAERVLLETGGGLKPKIDDMGKRMLLADILKKRKKSLRFLARAARQRNFTESLVTMIEEFKSYAVMPCDLLEATTQLADSPLRDKLQDLSLIYQDFTLSMQQHYVDGEDYLDLLAKRLKDSAILQDAQVFIDGFAFFNPQEMAIIKEIIKVAQSVTITLSLEDAQLAEHALETDVFHRQWKTLRKVTSLVEELGGQAEVIQLSGIMRFKQNGLRHIEDNLYRFPAKKLAAASGVKFVETANRRLEAEAVAADILRLCRDEGYRWRDIGVLVRDGENYHDLLAEVFHDYEIEFFSDAKRLCLHHPLAELVRSSLEALQGWRYEPLFRCFKTDFFAATRSQVDVLENYVLEFGIRGKRWLEESDWTYRKSLSLDEDSEIKETEAEFLSEINAIRRLLIEPLCRFGEQMKTAQNAAAMTRALYDLLVMLAVPEKLAQWAAAAEQQGDLGKAREHRQLWDNIVHFMDRLTETCGEESMTVGEYSALVNDGLESLYLSLIPPSLDYVTVASFEQNSLDNVKAVFIVGANEGIMPKRSRGEGLLTDAERLAMTELGFELPGGTGADTFAERYLIYAGFTRASEYLWISYPLSDSDGGGLAPSPLVKRLRDMLGECAFQAVLLQGVDGEDYWRIARPRQAISHLAGALREAKQAAELSAHWHDVYNWAVNSAAMQDILQKTLAGLFSSGKVEPLPPELAGKLYAKNRRLKGSVTRFEKFRACPFQHFAQYGLKLTERPEYRFAAPDLGQFLHAAMKRFGDKMAEENRDWGSVGDAEYREICRAIVGELAPKLQNEILLSTAQYQHLLKRMQRTVERSIGRLIAFAKVSAFKPVGLEQSFGRGQALPPLSYLLGDGYTLEITGQIDRIDCFDGESNRYFLVIDYKSGQAYLNLIDIYYGLKMQLLTYLLVVQNSAQQLLGKAAVPAGVLYYFLKNPLLTEKHKIGEQEALHKIDAMLKMPGWVMSDVDLVRQIDSSFKFIKVAVTAKNTIHGASKSSVKTPEEFTALLHHMDYLLADTGNRILRGDISVSPYEIENRQACTYCKYHSLCRFDRLQPDDEYRKLSKLDNEAIMKNLLDKEMILW